MHDVLIGVLAFIGVYLLLLLVVFVLMATSGVFDDIDWDAPIDPNDPDFITFHQAMLGQNADGQCLD